MATTGANVIKLTSAALVGSTVQAAGSLVAFDAAAATETVNGGGGTAPGLVTVNFATDGLAKHGWSTTTLTGTTPVTLSLADLTSNSTYSAGDTSFSSFSTLVFVNTGAADVTVAPGGSNPASLGLAGTTPTLTVPAGKAVTIGYNAVTVDSTHKTVLVTPTSGGSFLLGVAGA